MGEVQGTGLLYNHYFDIAMTTISAAWYFQSNALLPWSLEKSFLVDTETPEYEKAMPIRHTQ